MMFLQRALVIVFFVLAGVTAAGPARASCEGTTPAALFAVWYDATGGEMVTETGDATDRDFILVRSGQKEPFFFLNKFSVTQEQAAASPIFKDMEDKGVIRMALIDPPAENASPVAAMLRKSIAHAVEVKNMRQLTFAETDAAFDKTASSVRTVLAATAAFSALERMDECSYVLKGKTVYKQAQALGDVQTGFPGDDRSPTTIAPVPVCWGTGGRAIVLAFHWDWECQGEGDMAVPLRDLK